MTSRITAILAVIVLTFACATSASSATTTAVVECATRGTPTESVTITVGDTQRSYLLHVAEHQRDERLPVVLAFHGRTQTPEMIERYSGLDRLHAVLVYPRGLPGAGGKPSWSGTPFGAPGVDDVRFARTIIDDLRGWSCVDPDRVYATGKSDGGGLAAQLACREADVLRAVAPVAGAYFPVVGGCTPSRPISVLEFHGTDDRVIPYTGDTRRDLPDIHQWLVDWAQRDSCTAEGARQVVADQVTLRAWSGCAGGTQVAGYRIEGGGHTWPGALAPSGPGAETHAIDATALIAQFFGITAAR
ncbi:MAG: hypothetical protein ABR975_12620 [Vulcanimicrobiaceae bacterium]